MKIFSRAIKTGFLLAAGLCLSVLAAPGRAGVLDQVPADALVVVKINHLSQTNTKVANLLTTLGVTDMVPQTKDPLGFLESQAGLGAGLDTSGEAAAVILNGKMDGDGPPPFVLLLPVSDYKAFLGSMSLVRSEGETSVVHFKDDESDAFVQNWGSYAALSDKKANLETKHAGLKVSAMCAKQLEERDLCIFVNFPALKAVLLPKIKEGSEDAMKEMHEHAPKDMDAAKIKLAEVAMRQGVNVVTEFLNDAQGAAIGLSITPEGISSNMVVEFAPGTYLGNLATSMKNTDQPLLAGLPKENYFFYGGSIEDGKVLGQVLNDVADPLLKELAGMSDDGKKLADALQASKTSLTSVEGGAVGVIAPTAAIGQGSMIRYLSVYKGDAEKIKMAQTSGGDIQADIFKLLDLPKSQDMFKTTVTPAFKTVNDVKFDRILMEVDPDNTTPQAQQSKMVTEYVFGPDGASTLLGIADPKTVVMGMGIDDDLLGQVVDAAKGNKDVLTADLKAVDSGLPKNRMSVAYLDLGNIVKTFLKYAKANGMNMQMQVPANLPPMGFSAGTEGSSLRFDGYLPDKLLESMVQVGMQAYMQFGGGNHGGGGGL